MKSGIHPQYNPKSQVTCACGNKWTTGSTLSEIKVEICSNCHPFFTGKDKKVDRRGRLERFKKRSEQAETKAKTASTKVAKRAARADKKAASDKVSSSKTKLASRL